MPDGFLQRRPALDRVDILEGVFEAPEILGLFLFDTRAVDRDRHLMGGGVHGI